MSRVRLTALKSVNFDLVLMASFLALILLLLAAVAVGWFGMGAIIRHHEQTLARNVPQVEQARRIAVAAVPLSSAAASMSKATTPEEVSRVLLLIDQSIGQLREALSTKDRADGSFGAMATTFSAVETKRHLLEQKLGDAQNAGKRLAVMKTQAQASIDRLTQATSILVANRRTELTSRLNMLYGEKQRPDTFAVLDHVIERDLFDLQALIELRESLRILATDLDHLGELSTAADVAALKAGLDVNVPRIIRRFTHLADDNRRKAHESQLAILATLLGANGLFALKAQSLVLQADMVAMATALGQRAETLVGDAAAMLAAREQAMQSFQTEGLSRASGIVTAMAAIGAVSLLVAVGGGIMIRQHILHRLRRLLDRLILTGRGELDWHIAVAHHDDIGRMERALRIVQRQVRAKFRLEQQLKQRGLELEAKVIERTEQIRAEMTAHDAARAEAEQANQSKSQFLAQMSHEIRTPVGAMVGMLGFMKEPRAAQEREKLAWARQAASDLQTLLNDLLATMRDDVRAPSLCHDPFDVRALIQRVTRLVAPLATDKGLRFDVDIAPDCPPFLAGDAVKIQQVLVNLCGNAVKFTDQGFILLGVECDREADGRYLMRFHVRDTGIGMSEAVKNNLFKPFRQGHEADHPRAMGGTGLGLYICSRLTERMGGDLMVSSDENKGSHFLLSLTLPEAPPPDKANERTRADVAGLAGKSVLLVEDNPINARLADGLLKQAGATVVACETAALAVAAAGSRRFDIGLLDLDLPDMSGQQLASTLTNAGCAPRHLFALSALIDRPEREPQRYPHFGAVLPKPIDLATLAAFLDGGELDVACDNDTPAVIRRDIAALGADETAALIRDCLAACLAQTQVLAAAMAAGMADDIIARKAHRLRGMMANYALQPLCRLLADIEAEPRKSSHQGARLVTESTAAMAELREAAAEAGLVLSATPAG